MNYETIISNLRERGLLPLSERIARRHRVSLREMWPGSKTPAAARARHEFWATAYDPNTWTYPRLASLTGHSHSTVLMGARKHRGRSVAKTAPAAPEEKCA